VYILPTANERIILSQNLVLDGNAQDATTGADPTTLYWTMTPGDIADFALTPTD